MPLTDPALWYAIRDWPLPYRADHDRDALPPRTCTCFADCLRMKGDWTDDSAERITTAYRRFLYLKALSGQPVTPSACIDEAWHLHMTHPDDYAALCRAIGRDIPHGTDLSYAELQRAYDRGHALYAAEFDKAPPRDLWPTGEALTEAEKLGLVQMSVVGVSVFLGVIGFALKLWWVVVPLGVINYVLLHYANRWGGTSPEKMARCG